MDESTSLEELKKKVAEFRDKREWKRFHKPKDLSVAISIEASELQESFLWKTDEEVEQFLKDEKNLEKVKEEVGDVAIFLLNLSDILGIDLSETVLNKIRKNDEKYPVEKVKGIAKKYTEL